MPSVVVLAGPNGAGKSTSAPALLQETLGVREFVNADVIARGLSGFEPDRAALAAGRVMVARLRELARRRVSFAFETTLASRSLARWLERLGKSGYRVHLVFLWLPSAELAVDRVRDRVRMGGHSVPEKTIRRRYRAGLRNFFGAYRSLADAWRIYDNSQASGPRLIAEGRGSRVRMVLAELTWGRMRRGIENAG